jgi:hypothetical protein
MINAPGKRAAVETAADGPGQLGDGGRQRHSHGDEIKRI